MKVVDSFAGKYEFLSNFYLCQVKSNRGLVYPSSEHAYQASKFLSHRKRVEISQLATPFLAKKAGRALGIRPFWDKIKIGIMTRIVRAKFNQNPDLAEKLMALEGYLLIEGNWWGDVFWGWCNGAGENHLGRILMKIRDELLAKRKGTK